MGLTRNKGDELHITKKEEQKIEIEQKHMKKQKQMKKPHITKVID